MKKFEDEILENYKNLISNYEDSIQLYEYIIRQYDAISNESTDIFSNKIECYNTTPSDMILILYSLDGTEIYKSSAIQSSHTSVLNLSSANLSINTRFKVGYILTDSSSSGVTAEILRYVPDSNATAYYALKYPPYSFSYTGVVPPFYYPNADPYLKCSGLVYKNNATALTRIGLFSLEGTELYRTDLVGFDDTYKLNFKDANIEPSTLVTVKSLVAGSDSNSDVIMQYIPDSYYVGSFELHGGFGSNMTLFRGSYSLLPDPSTVENADKFMLYNNSGMNAKFAIILPDGSKVYETDTTSRCDSRHINISDLNVPIGMYVRVKVIIPAKDFSSDKFVRYIPNGGTAYLKLYGNAAIPSSQGISYYGVLSSEATPPLLKCSKIQAKNDSGMITKWSLKNGSTTLYLSGRYRVNTTWTLDLANISLQPGTRFLLKSNAIAGEDALGYVTLEYDPNSNLTAKFQLYGSSFKNFLIYEGTE